MNLSFPDFLLGLNSINKKAEEVAEPSNVFNAHIGSIFPTTTTQSKWQYARGPGKLQLHDGNTIHQFSFETENHEHDFPALKTEDVSYFDFGKGLDAKGVAQVHKSDPGHIYVTLHDGKTNPTYSLKHLSEHNWRATPKVKKQKKSEDLSIDLDIEAFSKGLTDKLAVMDTLFKGLHHGANMLVDGVARLGESPLASAGIGLGLGAAYDLGKRTFYNSEEENAQETGTERAMRYAVPSLGLGLAGGAMATLAPNRYKFNPVYNASNPNNYNTNQPSFNNR